MLKQCKFCIFSVDPWFQNVLRRTYVYQSVESVVGILRTPMLRSYSVGHVGLELGRASIKGKDQLGVGCNSGGNY